MCFFSRAPRVPEKNDVSRSRNEYIAVCRERKFLSTESILLDISNAYVITQKKQEPTR